MAALRLTEAATSPILRSLLAGPKRGKFTTYLLTTHHEQVGSTGRAK